MNWPLVLQVAGGLGGVTALVALFLLPSQIRKVRSDAGKVDAEAAQVLTDNALKLLAPARQEIDELEKRLRSANQRANDLESALKSSQGRVSELESEVQQLRNQVGVMTKEVTDLRADNEALRGGAR